MNTTAKPSVEVCAVATARYLATQFTSPESWLGYDSEFAAELLERAGFACALLRKVKIP